MTVFTPPPFLPYWRNETNGDLAKAISRFFAFGMGDDPIPLTNKELSLIKGYLRFWIDYPWLGFESQLADLRLDFNHAHTYEALGHCIDKAFQIGIDPF